MGVVASLAIVVYVVPAQPTMQDIGPVFWGVRVRGIGLATIAVTLLVLLAPTSTTLLKLLRLSLCHCGHCGMCWHPSWCHIGTGAKLHGRGRWGLSWLLVCTFVWRLLLLVLAVTRAAFLDVDDCRGCLLSKVCSMGRLQLSIHHCGKLGVQLRHHLLQLGDCALHVSGMIGVLGDALNER